MEDWELESRQHRQGYAEGHPQTSPEPEREVLARASELNEHSPRVELQERPTV